MKNGLFLQASILICSISSEHSLLKLLFGELKKCFCENQSHDTVLWKHLQPFLVIFYKDYSLIWFIWLFDPKLMNVTNLISQSNLTYYATMYGTKGVKSFLLCWVKFVENVRLYFVILFTVSGFSVTALLCVARAGMADGVRAVYWSKSARRATGNRHVLNYSLTTMAANFPQSVIIIISRHI